MIDTHMHGDSRSSEDFGEMYLSGIDTAITCAFYPYKLNNESTLLNHLERILNYDTKRAKEYGLDLKVALGIHPANTSVNPDLIYENLYKWIENKQIIAIGEIGLVHTPRKNKKEVLKVIQDIVPQHIDPKLVVIDHINQNVAEDVIDKDYTLGLTVQPQKMDKEEAIAILDEYGFDKFLLNSDISNKPSDPLSVPKTVRELEKLGYKKTEIEKVAFKNAEKFFLTF